MNALCHHGLVFRLVHCGENKGCAELGGYRTRQKRASKGVREDASWIYEGEGAMAGGSL